MGRIATRFRITSGSEITVTLDLDGADLSRISTRAGFYDRMLTVLSRHSLIDLDIQAGGDVHIDGHHVVEDTTTVLGQVLGGVLGNKRGVRCYADVTVPPDEAPAHYVTGVAGRLHVVCSDKSEGQVYAHIDGLGVTYAGSMTYHVFESLGSNADLCVHLRLLTGHGPHYIVEAEHKALAHALHDAVALDPRVMGAPSTEGAL